MPKLDKEWAELVKAGNSCEYCGKSGDVCRLNAHHFYSRSNHAVRWDLDNGFCLCSYHHCLGQWSAHKNPAEFVEWAIETRGQEWYEELRRKKNLILKRSEWKRVYAELLELNGKA